MLSQRRDIAAIADTARRSQYDVNDNVRAHLRVLVERILHKHGYPALKQEKATQTVLEQAAGSRPTGHWPRRTVA